MTDADQFHKAMASLKPLRRMGIFILAFCIFLLSQLLLGISLKTMLSMLPQIGALSPEIKEALENARDERTSIPENFQPLESKLSLRGKGDADNNNSEIDLWRKNLTIDRPRRCSACARKLVNSNDGSENDSQEMSKKKDDEEIETLRDMAVSANITTGINLIGSE